MSPPIGHQDAFLSSSRSTSTLVLEVSRICSWLNQTVAWRLPFRGTTGSRAVSSPGGYMVKMPGKALSRSGRMLSS